MPERINLKTLATRLGHSFKNIKLLEAALTHRSVRAENNERLEFLGDSIINFVIAESVYQQCPSATEGEMSRLRASLVKGETLAELAQEFKLGDYLKLGAGELRSGGFRNKSILADAMEAVVAAIYLDAGMQVCQQCILNWYGSRLQTSDEMTAEKDPKTRLQEFLQARKLDLPVYAVLSMEGEAHNQIFRVSCRVNNLPYITEGSAHSRRHAEQEAAQKYLDIIEHV